MKAKHVENNVESISHLVTLHASRKTTEKYILPFLEREEGTFTLQQWRTWEWIFVLMQSKLACFFKHTK